MLGNFSFGPVGSDDPKDFGVGGYFKRSAIYWGYEFLTQTLGINTDRITVSIFKGDASIPRDSESYRIWHEEIGIPKDKITEQGREDNFWGPTGSEGPCGPTSEIYVDGVEVWNLVFNEYYQKQDKTLEKLKTPGVDTGMGFERLVATIQSAKNVFETDLFHPLISRIRELAPNLPERVQRIFADHFRAGVFLIADGLRPSNKEAGYVLRRHLRRILAYKIKHDVHADLIPELVQAVSSKYSGIYPELKKTDEIADVFEDEKSRFEKAVRQGILEIENFKKRGEKIDAKKAFYLYETLGLPFELVCELVPKELAKDLKKEDFEREFEKHREISRAGMEKKFGGHGLILDTGELKAGSEEELKKVTRLHTATHLLHQALREVLGVGVRQMGSDITVERTRFDFSFPRKLTDEEKKKIEEIVNEKIKEDLPVSYKEMSKSEAEKTGALHFFKLKYPDRVKVYYVGKSLETAWSKEFCGGPHVKHTGEIGKFRIAKEEAVAAGVRRIRGVID
jgi:alanyl-tRNA synthetase